MYCPGCGQTCPTCGDEQAKTAIDREVEIARIQANRDIEVARLTAAADREVTETIADAEVGVAAIEAEAGVEAAEAVADVLEDIVTPEPEEPAEIIVTGDAGPAEPEAEPAPQPDDSEPALPPAKSARNPWWG